VDLGSFPTLVGFFFSFFLKSVCCFLSQVNLLYANLMEILDKKTDLRSTEMTEQLRALIVPPEDQGSVSSTNVAAQNHL
jgi:hypothetical protein